MRRWLGVTTGYLAACQARGMCEERLKSTRRELERLGSWLLATRSTLALEEIDTELLVNFIHSRSVFKARATVSGIVSKLRCFGVWLVQEGYWKKSPLQWLKGPKINPYAKAPQRISKESMTKLWQGAATSKSSLGQKKWLCALALLYGLGLRRGEMTRLNVKDWQSGEGLIRADARKTRKQLSLPLQEIVARCMEAYLPEREEHLRELGKADETALFISRRGNRLSGPALGAGLFRIAERMEVPLDRLHQFRHTCASDLIEAGVHLPEVQRLLAAALETLPTRSKHPPFNTDQAVPTAADVGGTPRGPGHHPSANGLPSRLPSGVLPIHLPPLLPVNVSAPS